jgi:hypothetical protein
MNIQIEYNSDKQNRETWSFWLCDSIGGNVVLYLDAYVVWRREQGKRKWEIVKQYQRIGQTRNVQKGIPVEEVPLSDDTKQEVLQKLYSSVQVRIWDKK